MPLTMSQAVIRICSGHVCVMCVCSVMAVNDQGGYMRRMPWVCECVGGVRM